MKVYGAWAPVNAIWPESRHVFIVFFRPAAASGPYTRLYFFFVFFLLFFSLRSSLSSFSPYRELPPVPTRVGFVGSNSEFDAKYRFFES